MPHLTDHARVASGDGAVTVSRKQFPCTNWLSCIAYSLHNVFGPCQTASHESSRRLSSALFFHYYIVAPHKVALHVLAPALTSYAVKDQYWLSVYVLLSRVRQFDDLLVLWLPDRAALDGGPPQDLVTESARLATLQQRTILDADRHLASLGLHALRSRVVEPLLQVLDPPRRWNVAEPFNNWRRKKTAPTYCISFASTPCTPWLSLEFRTPHTCCLLRAPPEAPTFHVRVFNQPRMQWAPQDFFLPLWSFCIHSKDISPQG